MGSGGVVQLALSPEALWRCTGIKRRRLNDNIDTRNQNYHSLVVTKYDALQADRSAMTHLSEPNDLIKCQAARTSSVLASLRPPCATC